MKATSLIITAVFISAFGTGMPYAQSKADPVRNQQIKQPPPTQAWQLNGNSGTSPGTDFVGTTDNQPLEIRVNRQRALRIEPNTNSPNVIAGFSGNQIAPGLNGVTISGGGGTYIDYDDEPWEFYPAPHIVNGEFATIAGGLGHSVDSYAGSVGGGLFNLIGPRSDFSAVAGGIWNQIHSNSVMSTIGGGELNTIQSNAPFSTISGGIANQVQGAFSFVGGGGGNWVGAAASQSVIAGGAGNICTAPFGTISGGLGAHASNYGQWAYSSGGFTGYLYGRAQTSLLVVRRRSQTSAPVELLLDGDNVGTQRINVPSGGRWGFEAMVIGTRPNGQTACFETKGAIKNVGNNTAFVGTPGVNKVAADTEAQTWNVVVEADSTNNALVFKVTGDDSGAVAWVGTVRTVEMNFDPGQ